MAKDGTQRGGPRRGTGPKPKAIPAIAVGDLTVDSELPDPYDLDGDDMPKVEDYMKDPQKDGSTLMAESLMQRWRLTGNPVWLSRPWRQAERSLSPAKSHADGSLMSVRL